MILKGVVGVSIKDDDVMSSMSSTDFERTAFESEKCALDAGNGKLEIVSEGDSVGDHEIWLEHKGRLTLPNSSPFRRIGRPCLSRAPS